MAPLTAILFLTAVLASGCVVHDRHGRAHITGPVVVQPQVVVEPPVAVVTPAPITFNFTDHHRHSVRNYYHEHPRHHGKKHKWKKKKWKKGKHKGKGRRHHVFRRHDHLPPGIQMQTVHVDLIRQLPHPPHGTRYIYHEDQVLLVNLKTRLIVDLVDIEVGF
jgi:Ni/Co efflux regulator RcnB